MDNELCVSCHAPSLSLLLFETARSPHDQRGLLIGEVCKEIISEKTDENEMNRQQRTTIYLEHVIPIKDSDLFGSIGNVNKQKFQHYLDQYCGKVVGWYSFRRNTRVNSRTLQEILTHKSLIHLVRTIRPEHFVAAFMSASIGANSSTHTYNHIFMRFHPERGVFEPLKLKIYTMSDKRINVNGYSIRNTFPTSKNFENIINSAEEEVNPVMSVLTINKTTGDYLKMINKELQEAERRRCELEQEIKHLRKRLSLDKLQEIKVRELDDEREPVGVQCIRYYPNMAYNPDRKENPIKIIPFYNTPTVPEEQSDKSENRSNQNETKKSNLSKGPPGFQVRRNRNRGRGNGNAGSHSNHFEAKDREEPSKLEYSNPDDDIIDGIETGNNRGTMGESIPDSDGNDQSVIQMEKSKVTGSVRNS